MADDQSQTPEFHSEGSEGEPAEQPPANESAEPDSEQPLASVRYGLGKELQLFPESLVVLRREEAEADHFDLSTIRRLVLTPGDPTPSKLILMLELDDDMTVIAAEGMSNVADFRKLLNKLHEIAPQIETDPPDMDEQLKQALDIRRRGLLGCYGSVVLACVLTWILYLALAYFGAHAGH